MGGASLILSFLLATFTTALASSSPLQDFCVADLKSPVLVNGFACKDPKTVQASDFFFSGLQVAANASNPFGSAATPVTVGQLPGLNTLDLAMFRFDFAPSGVIPPHLHHRASEVVTVLQGNVNVGFVASVGNRLISKELQAGDVFVFPQGLVHYLQNVGKGNAVVLAAFNSPNPGFIGIANSVFGSTPEFSTQLLAKSFKVDESVISDLQSKF